MRKSGYHTIFHIYLLFFLSLIGTILVIFVLFLLVVTVQKPDGSVARSDWPKVFTEDFKKQIIFINNKPKIKQAGLMLLENNHIGLQIIDNSGYEIYAFQTPESTRLHYSISDLLNISQAGHLGMEEVTSFIGVVSYQGNNYSYLVHFPIVIKKINMDLNGKWFTGGKAVAFSTMGILLFLILLAGMAYGFQTSKIISRLAASIRDISTRSYLPIRTQGAYSDLYDSLNILDTEIKTSDRLQATTEHIRREWIANITHDLKTPLSPIKGYAEILLGNTGSITDEHCRQYAGIMLKNAIHMDNLINDLKMTYQLENGMVPLNLQEQDIIRFLRELAIDLLNSPDYESRQIHFKTKEDTILFLFDHNLLTRVFQNLIINSFVHGDKDTEVTLQIFTSENNVNIMISDNGKGITEYEQNRLFERYYRGSNTENRTEGTGLGLAIAKSIVELHGGEIDISSTPNIGTTLHICFSRN